MMSITFDRSLFAFGRFRNRNGRFRKGSGLYYRYFKRNKK